MSGRLRSWNDVRGFGFLVAVAMACIVCVVTWAAYTALSAKAPGESHCYKDVCHRVFTLDETRRMIGQPIDLVATHYDVPEKDKMNTGELTSSGEAFDATNPGRTSASNYPDGTELLLWSAQSKRAAHVRVNDFGPFWGKRTIDVTRRVADDLGFAKAGVATLRTIVIWVPGPQAARYKRYRNYPSSLGLIGVVELEQLEPLARKLILTAEQRNRDLLPGPAEPTDTAADEAVIAASEAAMAPRRLADMVAHVPQLNVGVADGLKPRAQTYAGPPAFRAETIESALAERIEAERRVASLSLPQVTPLPEPPTVAAEAAPLAIVVAEASPPAQLEAASKPLTLEPRALPQPETALAQAALAQTALAQTALAQQDGTQTAGPGSPPGSTQVSTQNSTQVATAGPIPSNRSRREQQTFAASDDTPSSPAASVDASVGVNPPEVLPSAPRRPSLDQPVRVSVALAKSPFEFSNGTLPLWIGIALMLATLFGAASFRRRKAVDGRGASSVSAASANLSAAPAATPQDMLSMARQAASQAETDARELLAHERATRDVSSLAEAQAREELSRELTRRETAREAQMRAQLEVAAEAHAAAQRELLAIDEARRARSALRHTAPASTPPYVQAPASALGATARASEQPGASPSPAAAPIAAPAARALVAKPLPTKPVAIEPPPPVFPGISDSKLAAAVLGRAGSEAYWGNTIVAQARLDGVARSGSPLRVDGVVEGACYAPVIFVAEGAVVTGVLAADTIVVLGTVTGTLSGRKITVAKTAQVEGEIYYQTMSIDPQAQCDVSFRRLANDADPVEVGGAVYGAQAQSRAA